MFALRCCNHQEDVTAEYVSDCGDKPPPIIPEFHCTDHVVEVGCRVHHVLFQGNSRRIFCYKDVHCCVFFDGAPNVKKLYWFYVPISLKAICVHSGEHTLCWFFQLFVKNWNNKGDDFSKLFKVLNIDTDLQTMCWRPSGYVLFGNDTNYTIQFQFMARSSTVNEVENFYCSMRWDKVCKLVSCNALVDTTKAGIVDNNPWNCIWGYSKKIQLFLDFEDIEDEVFREAVLYVQRVIFLHWRYCDTVNLLLLTIFIVHWAMSKQNNTIVCINMGDEELCIPPKTVS